MSEYLLREASARIGALPIADAMRTDARAALDAAPRGPAQLFRMMGAEAELPEEVALERALAATVVSAMVNLADDVADGDCDYLDDPVRLAPATLLFLFSLALHWLAGAGLTPGDLHRIAGHWWRTAAPQNLEIRTTRWTLERAQEVAIGVAGHQYAAYLEMLWSGSRLAPAARRIGTSLGAGGQVALDVESADPRYTTLAPADRDALVAWARDRLEPARAEGLASLAPVLAQMDRSLARHADGAAAAVPDDPGRASGPHARAPGAAGSASGA